MTNIGVHYQYYENVVYSNEEILNVCWIRTTLQKGQKSYV